jgi:hypothetical protein
MSARRLAVQWEHPDDFDECDERTFMRNNRHDREACDAVQALAPGESVTLGGGASPVVIVTVLK